MLSSHSKVHILNSSQTFEVLDAYTWFTNVSSFPALDNQTEFGPAFQLEYSTREAYGGNVTGFGPNDPLNATWWHLVTEREYPTLATMSANSQK